MEFFEPPFKKKSRSLYDLRFRDTVFNPQYVGCGNSDKSDRNCQPVGHVESTQARTRNVRDSIPRESICPSRGTGLSSDFRIVLLAASSHSFRNSDVVQGEKTISTPVCGFRPRLQRRVRDGFSPSSMSTTGHLSSAKVPDRFWAVKYLFSYFALDEPV